MTQKSTISKRDLVETLATEADLSSLAAERALNSLLDVVTSALKGGTSVSMGSFGTFEPRQRSARQGRNPKTGEVLSIPAKTVAAFKPGAALKREMEASGNA